MRPLPPDRSPVVIGVGEIVDRTREPALAREPIVLMEEAVRRAVDEAAPGSSAEILARIDSLDIVSEHSWPYADACGLLNVRLQLHPRRAAYGVTGGESPVRYIHEAALRIARGESEYALVTGAEAAYSVASAAKAGVTPPWTPRDANARLLRAKDFCHPLAIQHGVVQPVHVYPLYENAAGAAWRQTQADALQESGELWSRFSCVAARNPNAWLQRVYTPEEIFTPAPANRMIAWPYTKYMTANPLVNQGAALVLTSLAAARELGVDDERLVHVWSGASASEPRDYLQRDHYHRSTAQEAVLQRALELAGAPFDVVELYSCFPIVPKMARRALGLDPATPMTVTGGLSFFGAPLNNYMTHAAAGLVRSLREQRGRVALLYGQGEFVTKHHALVLASSAPREDRLTSDYSVQAEAERRRDPAPALALEYAGAARLETFTIVYDRDGHVDFGCVIGLTPQGERLMARVRADDAATLAQLTRLDSTPVGGAGRVSRGDDGLLYWRLNRTDA
jgi:acetyl-CoA C-acetyltransferase